MNRRTQHPIDAVARSLATRVNRRGFLRGLGAGVAVTGAAVARRSAFAQNDREVITAPIDRGILVTPEVSDRPLEIDWYCPPGASKICLEPFPGGSTDPADLCTCKCPNDQQYDGKQCFCPAGTGCSGYAAAGRQLGPDVYHDREYTTEGSCCAYPQVAMACSNSAPGMSDGFALCCTPGVDCPFGYDGVDFKHPAGFVCAVAGRASWCGEQREETSNAIAGKTDY